MDRHVVIVQFETNLITFMNLDTYGSNVERRLDRFNYSLAFHLNIIKLRQRKNYDKLSVKILG